MPKKLTLGFVRGEIEKIGYKCLSQKYVNNNTKLKIQCDKGHTYNVKWSHIQRGRRCRICFFDRRKKVIEEVKEYVELFNYKCLSKEYINNYTKLRFQCDRSHIYEATYSNFRQGQRCPYCAGLKKKTIEEIHIYVESFNYKCLSDEYVNSSTKLKFKCGNNHQFIMTWNHIQRGDRCPICYNNNRGVSQKLNIEYVKTETTRLTNGDYKCLSEIYINASNKLEFQCSNDHIYKAKWTSFLRGQRCPICWTESISGENHPNWKNYTEEDRKNIISYRDEITQLTNINYKKYFYLINPNKLNRSYGEYHLDHIYSVIDGFNNNVSPEIIASPVNLQMLSEKDNISKNGTSHMTLEQLYDLHKQFLEELIK